MTQPLSMPRGSVVAPARVAAGASVNWLYYYLAFQFACQLALLSEDLNAIRVVVRSGAFLGAVALLLLVPTASGAPAIVKRWCYAILSIMALASLNPEGNGFVAAVAQIGLNLAVIAPVFWVSRLEITPAHFARVIFVLWLFYSTSALFGVLQVYFPGSFQPALSTVVADRGKDMVMSLQIELASGERVFRPMGLTDMPGGAAAGGLYALVLGIGVLQARHRSPLVRPLVIGGMLVGAMCLYLCQVRSLVVMAGICLLAFVALQAFSGRVSRFLGSGMTLLVVLPLAFYSAISLGGRGVTDRLNTLTEQNPSDVYYSHRGHFLLSTIDKLLPRYPFGAGLGRWGMVNRYFGSRTNSLWVEIQWTGWLLDGGVPLVLAYTLAILTVTYLAFRLAIRKEDGVLNSWAALVVAYNVGALALCFSYVLFIGTAGVEFWLINAALLQAARYQARAPALPSSLA